MTADPAEDEAEESVRRAVDDGFPSAVAALTGLVRIPSVAFPGFDHGEVARSAEAVAELFRGTGLFPEVLVERSATDSGEPGQPAVVARRPAAPGAPTILLYAHHDVQPAGADEAWTSPPFQPTLRGERLYGRGASDDKAGVITHFAALTAAKAALGDDFACGVALFIEGEEEAGSRSFAAFLADHHDLLDADAIVVADSGNESTTTPALTVSLRGNATFVLTLRTLGHPVHSGMFGGAVPDAMLALTRLLATLWDDAGDVAVDGLRRTSAPGAVDAESEAAVRRDAELAEGVATIGTGSVADRVWRAPAITITGIDAPDVRNASNTLLAEVRVRISVRVAPGQDAAEAFSAVERHLLAHAPFGATPTFDEIDLGQPFLVDSGGWAAADARAALEDGWGAAPDEIGVGGSIPFVATLTETFPNAQILITGVEDPDSRAHAPDESQHLGVLKRGIVAEALLLDRLSRRRIEP